MVFGVNSALSERQVITPSYSLYLDEPSDHIEGHREDRPNQGLVEQHGTAGQELLVGADVGADAIGAHAGHDRVKTREVALLQIRLAEQRHLHTHLAQWEQAIEWCGKSIASGSQIPYTFVDLAAANAWAGHDKEAKDAAAQLQKVYPGFTAQTWAGFHWTDDPTFNAQYQRITEGLRKAGVPEGEKKTD